MDNENFPEKELTGKIIGIAIAAHKRIGPGYPEKVYHRILFKDFRKEKLFFRSQFKIEIFDEKTNVGFQTLDFLVANKVIVEIKSVREILNIHIKQVIAYLKAADKRIGLILNFGKNVLEIKRVIL